MSVVEIIRHYQRSLTKCGGDLARTFHCVSKLYNLPVTVQHLQETGIGRTVNALRKYEGDCGDAAKACVAKWKAMVAAEESSDPDVEDRPAPDSEERNSASAEHKPHPSHRDETSKKKSHREDQSRHIEKTSRREESTNKTRDKALDEYDRAKRHRDKLASSASSSDERPASSDAEELRHRVNGSSKQRKDKPGSTEQPRMSKGRDDSSHRHEEKKKEKRREELSGKERSRAHASGSADETTSRKHLEEDTVVRNGNRHREKERRREPEKKTKAVPTEDGSIDFQSGASFEEALGIMAPKRRSSPSMRQSPSKGASSSTKQSPSKSAPPSTKHSPGKSSKGASPSTSRSPSKAASPSKSSRSGKSTLKHAEFDFLSSSLHLEPLDAELSASIESLPAINPNYRPLPNTYNPYDSPPSKKMKNAVNEEALAQLMYHKAERTRVYSGVKGPRRSQPTSLFDCCVRVLQDNIHALGYTGGVPYSILKPVLEKASAEQLLELEHFNPYLVEDSDELWEFHVNKQFRTLQPQEMESNRERFMRGLDERAAKLEVLKCNIKQSQATSVPVRQAKMTYMDSVAKPPREVARQQARNGTARPVPRGVPGPASSLGSSRASAVSVKQKPRVAPLMQKAMKFAKTFKR